MTVGKMFAEVKRIMHEQRENFNKDIENIFIVPKRNRGAKLKF